MRLRWDGRDQASSYALISTSTSSSVSAYDTITTTTTTMR